MRRLLEIHHQLSNKEMEIRAVHFGVILEREWYLRKLRALEDVVGPPRDVDVLREPGGSEQSATLAFAGAVRSILYEDSDDFSLVGAKW
ncbi:hypothetical protein CBR_g26224 [Chara braunii]|uniref:Uncharacterized protein n=1 Tax=Chara braunii TaxID=69332 RepID=A0A388L792_CHABU|nr:hypothetical protein CBR_g26224 [Chara braunii]|eukprot:GBG78191.1 hypothetical protein CBR_g26224 [Chara braunii]